MQITIKKIDVYTKDKAGNQLQGKFGPCTKVRVIDDAGKQFWGYGSKETDSWQVGQVIEVEVNVIEKNGNVYNNFRTLSREDKMEKRITKLEEAVFIPKHMGIKAEELPPEEDEPFTD